MKHDVAILLALVAVLAAGVALVLAGADFRARREDRRRLEELRARRPYFGWENENRLVFSTSYIPSVGSGIGYVSTAW